jgi:serine/threonine protein kinase
MREGGTAGDAAYQRLRGELAPELELVRPLGKGSVAQVYLAREPALERLVAVKVLRNEVAGDEVARQRFERESRAAARIKHPNVPAIYRVATSGEFPRIVMEYVEGRTLADMLAARGPLSVPEARRVLASAAHALAAVHAKGIVHRDLRPANVMVENESGRVLLVDFGIVALRETGAATHQRLTATGIQVGDPRHMSPEQLRGEPAGPAADIYGLGIVAYELLLGSTPLPEGALASPRDGGSSSDALRDGLRLRPLNELCSDVDPAFTAVVHRCLAPLAEHRPRAIEVAEALVREPDSAVVTTPPRPAVHAVADHPAVKAIPGLGEFVTELQRRKVGSTALTYVLAASLPVVFVNAFAHVFPGGEGGAWHRIALATILGGFPLALMLSWLLSVTPGGIGRERSPAASTVPGQKGLKRLWFPLVGFGLVVLLSALLWKMFAGR